MSGWFIPFELILIVETSSPVLELFNRIVIDSWDLELLKTSMSGFSRPSVGLPDLLSFSPATGFVIVPIPTARPLAFKTSRRSNLELSLDIVLYFFINARAKPGIKSCHIVFLDIN